MKVIEQMFWFAAVVLLSLAVTTLSAVITTLIFARSCRDRLDVLVQESRTRRVLGRKVQMLEPVEVMVDEISLSSMGVRELRKLAPTYGVSIRTPDGKVKNKAELISSLLQKGYKG